MRSKQLSPRVIGPRGIAYFTTKCSEPFRVCHVDVLDQGKLDELMVVSLITGDREHVTSGMVPMAWLARDSGMPPISALPAERITVGVHNPTGRSLRVSPRLTEI